MFLSSTWIIELRVISSPLSTWWILHLRGRLAVDVLCIKILSNKAQKRYWVNCPFPSETFLSWWWTFLLANCTLFVSLVQHSMNCLHIFWGFEIIRMWCPKKWDRNTEIRFLNLLEFSLSLLVASFMDHRTYSCVGGSFEIHRFLSRKLLIKVKLDLICCNLKHNWTLST